MENITSYFRTIVCVFICLSSAFIFIQLVRVFINKKKTSIKNKSKIGFRYDRDLIETKIERKYTQDINSDKNKNMDKKLKGEKVFKYDNGDLYKGEFIDGKKNGFGTYIFSSKERYEGLWKDDKMHGIGKYTYKDGSIYTGEFKDGLKNGLGKLTYPNNDIYKGYFLDNKKNGKGVLYKSDGNKQAGIWENDEQCKSLDFKELSNKELNNNIYQNRLNDNKIKI
ncbi:hypothetical protein C4R89_00990 [Clostridioides difficile]|nr:hypothetical protein [Clostridioides difficile]MDB0438113.1 hypothetical protein [Clostridioides difficile]